MSALSLWTDSTPLPAKDIDSAEFIHSKLTEFSVYVCSMYLLTEPPSTDSSIVMSNGDSAEGTEECSNFNIKDVCAAPLKVSSLQKHLEIKLKYKVTSPLEEWHTKRRCTQIYAKWSKLTNTHCKMKYFHCYIIYGSGSLIRNSAHFVKWRNFSVCKLFGHEEEKHQSNVHLMPSGLLLEQTLDTDTNTVS